MNKLEIAHECAMKLVGNPSTPLKTIESIVDVSWAYADAMQAEADKRDKQKAIDDAESSKVFFEKLTDSRSLIKDEEPK